MRVWHKRRLLPVLERALEKVLPPRLSEQLQFLTSHEYACATRIVRLTGAREARSRRDATGGAHRVRGQD